MLTTPKPLNPNEWLADTSDCKGFYQALQKHLIESVSQQLDAIPSEVAYLFQEHPSGHFDDEAYELADQLRSTVLEVHGVHFPASEKQTKWDYLQLFTLTPKLHFVNCHFYCSGFSHEFLQPHFTGCTFHQKFRVLEWDAPEEGLALFESCCFKQKVNIKGNELGRFPLMGYSSVFKDCELAQVSVKNTEVDTGSSGFLLKYQPSYKFFPFWEHRAIGRVRYRGLAYAGRQGNSDQSERFNK